jgi:hypothetical protein
MRHDPFFLRVSLDFYRLYSELAKVGKKFLRIRRGMAMRSLIVLSSIGRSPSVCRCRRIRDADGIPSGDRASVGEATWAKTVVLVPYARMPQRPHRTPRWSRRPPAYAVLQLLGVAHCER